MLFSIYSCEMLQSDPLLRPTAADALRHEWFASDKVIIDKLLIFNENTDHDNLIIKRQVNKNVLRKSDITDA